MPKIHTLLFITSATLPALLIPACGGGLEHSAEAQSTATPWCCDVPDKLTFSDDSYIGTATTNCYVALNGTSCPNARAASGPPSGYLVSLEVTPENGCTLPEHFAMGASYTETFSPAQPTFEGWCGSFQPYGIPNTNASTCVNTYATDVWTSCAFSTTANFGAPTDYWLAYCLAPIDTSYSEDLAPSGPPTACDAENGDCCYPLVQGGAGPVTTTASAGFRDTGCTPAVCSGTCGEVPDGCGNTINCGSPSTNTCGSFGSDICGQVGIGHCGGVAYLDCGACPQGSACLSNHCVAGESTVPAMGGGVGWPLMLALSLVGAGSHAALKRRRN